MDFTNGSKYMILWLPLLLIGVAVLGVFKFKAHRAAESRRKAYEQQQCKLATERLERVISASSGEDSAPSQAESYAKAASASERL
jgi:Tfp pilus assembly protein PilV